mmetsp:Transcript_170/g.518  ORF Transcript_170/g.518 Transcript_170/m.518 type:complete len:236 (-) Transcript_170:12-719(-)
MVSRECFAPRASLPRRVWGSRATGARSFGGIALWRWWGRRRKRSISTWTARWRVKCASVRGSATRAQGRSFASSRRTSRRRTTRRRARCARRRRSSSALRSQRGRRGCRSRQSCAGISTPRPIRQRSGCCARLVSRAYGPRGRRRRRARSRRGSFARAAKSATSLTLCLAAERSRPWRAGASRAWTTWARTRSRLRAILPITSQSSPNSSSPKISSAAFDFICSWMEWTSKGEII